MEKESDHTSLSALGDADQTEFHQFQGGQRCPKSIKTNAILAKLIEPLTGIIDQCKSKRKCNALTGQQWIETGLLRIISQQSSGRSFLQKLFDSGRILLSRSLFFETLERKRRLKLCQEVNFTVYQNAVQKFCDKDPLAQNPELDDYDIFAGDGHYHAAAAHDLKKTGKKYATQHFYAVNLRNHFLRHLTVADTSGPRKKRE